ncbi:MAG: hypothetical protein ABFS28_17265, partial [Bacteroidota bacterium]
KASAKESISEQQEQEQVSQAPTPVTVLSESKVQTSYRHILSQAIKHQAVSDSLTDLANHTRTEISDSDDPNDRWVWQKQIMLWEKKAHDQEEIAEELYAKLESERAANKARVSGRVPDAIEVDTVLGEMTVYRYKKSEPPPVKTIPDGIEILDRSPYSPQNPIPMNVPLPAGVFYSVQLGSFKTEAEADSFQGISPITGMRAENAGRVKYFAGKFRKYADVSAALSMIRSRGFEDAFIVAWYNGNIVSTQKAKQLE